VGEAGSVWAGSSYVVAAGGGYVTLIEDQSGQVTRVSRAGCGALGPSALEPWICRGSPSTALQG
jgi:hypothetical protein